MNSLPLPRLPLILLTTVTLFVNAPVVCAALPSCPEQAQNPTSPQQPSSEAPAKTKSEKTPKVPKTVSARDQQAAMEFVREHHPELAHLLEQLQKSRPDEFLTAIRQLVPQTQAIQRLRERAPARYPAQLEAWKRDSEIRLLIARWARSQDPQLETRIKELITQRQTTRQTELKAEQQRLEEQLLKVQEQLQTFSTEQHERVADEWEQLSRQAAAAARSAKSSDPKSKTKSPKTQPNPSSP